MTYDFMVQAWVFAPNNKNHEEDFEDIQTALPQGPANRVNVGTVIDEAQRSEHLHRSHNLIKSSIFSIRFYTLVSRKWSSVDVVSQFWMT